MVELVLRVVVSLGVVLGAFWFLARVGSRRLGGRDRHLVRVCSRQSLSRGSSLAVVEVGSRVLVVGVSDSGVRLLTELDPAELGSASSGAGGSSVPQPRSSTREGDADGDADAYAEAAWASYQAHAIAPLPSAPLDPGPRVPVQLAVQPAGQPAPAPPAESALPRARAASPGGLSGSLLAPATWRQAWGVASGLGSRSRRRDAA